MDRPFLSYGKHCIDQADIDAVVAVLKSDFLTTGPAVSTFEQGIAKVVNEKFVTCVNSGTAALHVAMAGLGIGPGDWVIVPAITFLASANAVRWCGAEVIFADVDPDNGLMGALQLQQAIEKNRDKNIKAVVPVHLAGQTENMAAIHAIARDHHLWIIEDACHAFGTEYIHDTHYWIGECRHSDAVIFSFHPVKTIAMGEGGAMTTRHAALHEAAMKMRSHGIIRDLASFTYSDRARDDQGIVNPWYYEMLSLGLNYRASDINCALGLSQLNKLPIFMSQRRQLAALYDELLAPFAPIIQPIKKTPYSRPTLHLYSVLIDFSTLQLSRATVMQQLQKQGISTQVHYIPVNEQPYYQQRYQLPALAGANAYYQQTLSVPLYATMTPADVIHVVNSLGAIIKNAKVTCADSHSG